MPDRPAGDVRLGDLPHRDRRLHARLDAFLLQEVLQAQAVDDGAQHSHVVAAGPVHAALREQRTAEHVAATDDDADLHTVADDAGDLASDARDGHRVDAQLLTTGEGLAGELEQDPVPDHLRQAPTSNRANRLSVTPASSSTAFTVFLLSRT